MGKNRGKGSNKRKVCSSPQQQHHQPEDWCFECKDGGELMICDYPSCTKVYHENCLGKDESFLANAKSWVCAWHYCLKCKKSSKFYCYGCPNAVCKKCLAASEFTVVKGEKGLCSDCAELVVIIEQNLEHDSEGNKISLEGRETYEGLFKEYWEIIKANEGLSSDDVCAAQANYKKVKNSQLQRNVDEEEEGEEEHNDSVSRDSDEDDIGKGNSTKRKKSKVKNYQLRRKIDEEGGGGEEQNDSVSRDSDEDDFGKCNSTKRKKSNLLEFVGWGSKPLTEFLVSIGKYSIEPLTQWGVRSLIYDYIKEKNLYDPRDRRKFFPDEKLFPIFKKKVMSQYQIYHKLEVHLAETVDDRDEEENSDQDTSSPLDKCLNDQASCKESKLSSLIGKPLLKKGDIFMKASCFASISASNIKLIYLKQSLVLELSKQPESFMSKVIGAFVRVKVDSGDHRQMKSHLLVRVAGVVLDEILKRFLLQVSFMTKAIPISELSDDDFTEQECEDFQQKVKANLLLKLTVMEVQEKAKSLHEDITKHWIGARLIDLQNQIDRANLRGRVREKFALLDEREQLALKQEQLLQSVPSVSPELMETEFDPEQD